MYTYVHGNKNTHNYRRQQLIGDSRAVEQGEYRTKSRFQLAKELMATKTLTIMEDVYDLLVANKRENESFSDELRRILSKKRTKLNDVFGILTKEEGEGMIEDLMKRKLEQIRLQEKKRR